MTTRVESDSLIAFCVRVLVAAGISRQDAEITANALVAADLRGIDSHGVAHLGRYVGGLENGTITAHPNIKILNETSSTALLDGDRGLGFVVAHRSMELAIQKAKAAGSGLVVARRSTHYGAAGYWAAMALSHGLIGFSMTNAGPKVAPTFGSRAMLGTNPIGLAVPADQEPPFVLDMATSVVPAGRLEIYARKGQSLPDGWVIDSSGQPIHDPVTALTAVRGDEMSILPLGGEGESLSGYKGYGLSMGVEILSSMLAGYPGPVDETPGVESEVGQLFGAISIEAFRPLAEFTAVFDRRLQAFKQSPPLPDAKRVLVAGQKEFEAMQDRLEDGIPLHHRVVEELNEIGNRLHVAFDCA